jgi:ABC-2 type transport system permease protein
MHPLRSDVAFAPAGVWLLMRMKSRALLNGAREILSDAPIKLLAAGVFIALIWFVLYELFVYVFEYFRLNQLQAAVAIPLLFNFFFVTLLVMLAFSNAILMYGTLFAHEESAYLLSSPLRVHSTVTLKYAESLFFSSWSLLLLGMPLMMAIAGVYEESTSFYAVFIALFVGFVPIPGAIGLLVAWFIARFVPRSAGKLLVSVAVVILVLMVAWGLRSVHDFKWISDEWLDGFFARMSLIQSSILPSTWVTRGIESVLSGNIGAAIGYLTVTVANAIFMSWLAIRLVSAGFLPAYDRAGITSNRVNRKPAEASGGVAGWMFFFLPGPARLIAAKDMRTFFRDPMQWSQLAILFGLMSLYLLNTPRFDIDRSESRLVLFVPFLNLGAVSFILATFTSRFVFPMVSLEGHQLWLIGLLPISRSWILVAKFSFAFMVTMSVATGVMMLASYILKIGTVSTLVYLSVTASVCFGLCGLAVGIGARLPMFRQRNPARIANGLGGTINLIASVGLICVILGGMGFVTMRMEGRSFAYVRSPMVYGVVGGVIVFGVAAGVVALIIGARHLRRVEA